MSQSWKPQDEYEECFVCERMRERKPVKSEGILQTCLLCDRDFCEMHKGAELQVCEINHISYYRNHPQLHHGIYPDLAARNSAVQTRALQTARKLRIIRVIWQVILNLPQTQVRSPRMLSKTASLLLRNHLTSPVSCSKTRAPDIDARTR
jgi:hypothetical protein